MSEKIAVAVPTEKDYDTLMEAYETKGWVTWLDDRPEKYRIWDNCKSDTHISFYDGFCYGSKQCYIDEGYKIITVKEALERLKEDAVIIDEKGDPIKGCLKLKADKKSFKRTWETETRYISSDDIIVTKNDGPSIEDECNIEVDGGEYTIEEVRILYGKLGAVIKKFNK